MDEAASVSSAMNLMSSSGLRVLHIIKSSHNNIELDDNINVQ